jgi:hypothetical protein
MPTRIAAAVAVAAAFAVAAPTAGAIQFHARSVSVKRASAAHVHSHRPIATAARKRYT